MNAQDTGPEILPDVIAAGLKVVFCGMAVGPVSGEKGAYYAHPQSAFWSALHHAGFTDRVLAPEEFHCLCRYRLGLTDLVKRAAGVDQQIHPEKHDLEALRQKILKFCPEYLAFTGKGAAKVFLWRRTVDYGAQQETVGGTKLFVLSSPSPAGRKYWDEGPWRELAHDCGAQGVAQSFPPLETLRLV
jgi:TDG/mug DNA glycosylase family protein